MNEHSLQRIFDARFQVALATDGYQSFAPLHYARIVGDLLQFFVAHCCVGERSGIGVHAQLTLEASTMLLCEPHGFLSLDLGGSFPDEQQPKTYVATSEAQSERVSELAVLDYLTVGRARMARRSRLEGLMDHVFTLLGHSGSPHLWFTLAAGHARMGHESRARGFAQEALARYRQCAEHEPQAPWPHKGEQRAELLVRELYAVRSQQLLDGWKAGTLRALGLEKLAPVAE